MLPKATITLTWMKGEVNVADAVSKLHFNAVELINSDLYRHGPPGLATIDGKDQLPLYQLTNEGEKCIPLTPELINRARDQEKRLLELDPEWTLSNKIENTLCVTCEEPEECGIYLTTRSMTKDNKGNKPWHTRSCMGPGVKCGHIEDQLSRDSPTKKRTIAGRVRRNSQEKDESQGKQ